MADRQYLANKYTQVVGRYQWLQYYQNLVTDAYIDEGVKGRIGALNMKESVSYLDSQGLKSGRDAVSGYTWYDIRKRVRPEVVQLVAQLFRLDKHRLLMLRWVCRGASVYVAFCKVVESEPSVYIHTPQTVK